MKRKSPRRILMSADCVGGVWTYAIDLIGALAAHDVEVTLFVSGNVLSTAQMIEASQLENLAIVRSELKLEWMAESETDIAEATALLADLEAAVRPDLVHVNGYAYAAAGFAAPVVVVAHACVPTWWRACRNEALPAATWATYRKGMAAGVAAADCLVAPTAAHLAAFRRDNPAPRDARVIHNGRDPSIYAPAAHKAPVVLAASRFWDEGKNLDALVAAAGAMHHEVRVAGEGVRAARNITRLGSLRPAALAREMAEAAVFVAPARYKPFGLSVVEAALSGSALVLADIPTMRELWDGAATFVDPDDPKALAVALDRIAGDPGGAARLGKAARARARTYSATAMARAYSGLYAELIAARPTPIARSSHGIAA